MTVLPIVERELRVAARNKMTYRGRVTIAIVASFFLGWLMFAFNRTGLRGMGGAQAFSVITQFVFVFCVLVGLGSTSDSISSERREGTLGFLFLTDLSGLDIVLGKLMSSSLGAFFGLLAALPPLSVTLLLGGVGWEVYFRSSLALLNALFFAAAAGLVISTFCKDGRKVMGAVSGLVWFGFMSVPNLPGRADPAGLVGQLLAALQWVNPGSVLNHARTSSSALGTQLFWSSLAVNHLLGWVLIAAASWFLPRRWQDVAGDAKQAARQERWRDWLFGRPAWRLAFRRRLLDINAFYWLVSRRRWAPVNVWIACVLILAAVSLLLLVPGFLSKPLRAAGILGIVMSIALYYVLKISLLGSATRAMLDQRTNGAIELLLCTSLGVPEILRGQWLALRRLYLAPVLATIAFHLVVWSQGLSTGGFDFNPPEWDPLGWTLAWFAGMTIFVLDLFALGWSGMCAGMTAKPAAGQRPAGPSLTVLILPWPLLMIVIWIGNRLLGFDFNGRSTVIAWFIISLLTSVIVIHQTRKRLLREFRLMATDRFQPEPEPSRWWAVWERFGRKGQAAASL